VHQDFQLVPILRLIDSAVHLRSSLRYAMLRKPILGSVPKARQNRIAGSVGFSELCSPRTP
jgi:hypothetical protein